MSGKCDIGSLKAAPGEERNRYSNKESIKVNAGLSFGLFPEALADADYPELIIGDPLQLDIQRKRAPNKANHNTVLLPEEPTVKFLASQLKLPPVPVRPAAPPSVEKLVHTLLHPSRHAFVHGLLSLQWVIGALGYEAFEFDEGSDRFVLKRESELRLRGAQLGLPAVYLEWLCGGDSSNSPTEIGVLLTPRFFEQLANEREEVHELESTSSSLYVHDCFYFLQ